MLQSPTLLFLCAGVTALLRAKISNEKKEKKSLNDKRRTFLMDALLTN